MSDESIYDPTFVSSLFANMAATHGVMILSSRLALQCCGVDNVPGP